MTRPVAPPRWPLWWLGFLLPRSIREAVAGDLAEAFHHQAEALGPAAARRWYRREAWRLIRSLGAYREDPVSLTPPRPPFHGMGTDLRLAFRHFHRRPGFVLVALLTLSLGIGANTAIFSVIKPILLDGLPYPHAGRLVSLAERDNQGAPSFVGWATFDDLRAQSKTLDRISVIGFWQPTLLGRGESEQLNGRKVSAEFFSMLGIEPALGRDFRPEEDRPNTARVAILSYRLWASRFGADPSIVGRTISLNEYPYQVVGVLPADFEDLLGPGSVIYSPLRYDNSLSYACRDCRHLEPFGRLAEGTTLEEARQELTTIINRLARTYPDSYAAAMGMIVDPLQVQLTAAARTPLWALFGGVGLVLLLACVNVANLLIGQARQRQQEFAIRVALGAPAKRVVRQILVESGTLGLVGALLGLGLAQVVIGLVRSAGPTSLPRLQSIGLDWGVLGFAAMTGIVAGLGFGLGPALSAMRQANQSWRHAGRVANQRGSHFARKVLVVAEVALALMLVIGAGLLLRSMSRLLAVNPGFEPERLLTLNVGLVGRKFDSTAVANAYYARVLEATGAVPGVRAAGLVSQLPLGGNIDSYGLHIESKPEVPDPEAPSADRYAVSGPYFAAMSIPLIAGRLFTEADRAGSVPVVIINQTMARLEWPGRDPLGDRIQLGGKETPWRTIVGVVGDVRHSGLDRPLTRQLYLPEEQWLFADGGMVLVARTSSPPDQLAPAVRRAIRSIDPDPTLTGLASMELVIRRSTAARRFLLVLFEGFALIALLLAAAGVYGVMASGVVERFKEFGIRAALGASKDRLLRQVLGEALSVGAIGIAIGSLGALALGRLVRGLLFELGPNDAVTYLGAAAILGLIAILAAWVPASRAARLDPTITLRSE